MRLSRSAWPHVLVWKLTLDDAGGLHQHLAATGKAFAPKILDSDSSGRGAWAIPRRHFGAVAIQECWDWKCTDIGSACDVGAEDSRTALDVRRNPANQRGQVMMMKNKLLFAVAVIAMLLAWPAVRTGGADGRYRRSRCGAKLHRLAAILGGDQRRWNARGDHSIENQHAAGRLFIDPRRAAPGVWCHHHQRHVLHHRVELHTVNATSSDHQHGDCEQRDGVSAHPGSAMHYFERSVHWHYQLERHVV